MGETGASTSDGFSLRGRLFLLEARPTYTGSTVTEVPCSPITQAKQRKWPLVWSRGSGKFACRDTEKSLGGAGWRGQRPALGKAGSRKSSQPAPVLQHTHRAAHTHRCPRHTHGCSSGRGVRAQ